MCLKIAVIGVGQWEETTLGFFESCLMFKLGPVSDPA